MVVLADSTSGLQTAAERRLRAAEVVPDMHMVRGRINRLISKLRSDGAVSASIVEGWVADLDGLLKMLARILEESPSQGIKFANEIYICRHLLSQAYWDLDEAVTAAEEAAENGDIPFVERAAVRRQLRCIAAAKTSINAAEEILPRDARTIDGESFWDRFSRLSHEREDGAEQQLMRDRGN